MIARALLLLLLSLLAGCVTPPPAPREFTLVYTGNLDGELEPCGCSEAGNLGGIKRQVAMLDRLRETDPELILVSSGGLIASEIPQDRIKADFILQGLGEAHYDAIGLQWRDLAYGVDLLLHHPLPWVASNWRGDEFPRQRTIRRPGLTLAVFQWLDPAKDPQKIMGQGRAERDPAALLNALHTARTHGAITLLGATLPLALWEKRPPFPLNEVDILIQRSRYEKYGEPRRLGDTWVLQPGSRGMRLGQARFRRAPDGKLELLDHRVIPLPKDVGEAERLADWYDAYNAAVKADYQRRVALRKSMARDQGPYAGEATCKTCHPKEHARWRTTPHAQAFYALQDVNKAFDPECITCHTLGFERPGGFIDPQLTPDRLHVQCENCHGPARAHAQRGGAVPTSNHGLPKAEICAQCHIHEHSPEFELGHYWSRIAHGKEIP